MRDKIRVKLEKILLVEYGIKATVQQLDTKTIRDNIFTGVGKDQKYIIKLEDTVHLTPIKISIQISNLLNATSSLKSSNYIKTLDGNYFVPCDKFTITVQVK
jgi:hypothetical protein